VRIETVNPEITGPVLSVCLKEKNKKHTAVFTAVCFFMKE